MPLSTDTFNRTNNTSAVGTTDGAGSADPLTWTTQTGTCGISSNTAYASAVSSSRGIATVSLAAADVDISLKLSTLTTATYLLFRYRTCRTTGIWVGPLSSSSSSSLRLPDHRVRRGRFAHRERHRACRRPRHPITVYKNGTQRYSGTDSFNNWTIHGVYFTNTTGRPTTGSRSPRRRRSCRPTRSTGRIARRTRVRPTGRFGRPAHGDATDRYVGDPLNQAYTSVSTAKSIATVNLGISDVDVSADMTIGTQLPVSWCVSPIRRTTSCSAATPRCVLRARQNVAGVESVLGRSERFGERTYRIVAQVRHCRRSAPGYSSRRDRLVQLERHQPWPVHDVEHDGKLDNWSLWRSRSRRSSPAPRPSRRTARRAGSPWRTSSGQPPPPVTASWRSRPRRPTHGSVSTSRPCERGERWLTNGSPPSPRSPARTSQCRTFSPGRRVRRVDGPQWDEQEVHRLLARRGARRPRPGGPARHGQRARPCRTARRARRARPCRHPRCSRTARSVRR